MTDKKLTLPIQVGRSYFRRDGVKVTITELSGALKTAAHYVDANGDQCSVFAKSGRVWSSSTRPSPKDLVADVSADAHPHAESMRLYAEDAARTSRPWELWECKHPDEKVWGISKFDESSPPAWYPEMLYRRIPKTIRIGEFDVPMPLRDAPAHGGKYFIVAPESDGGVDSFDWAGDVVDRRLLASGMAFATKDDASKAYEAVASLFRSQP